MCLYYWSRPVWCNTRIVFLDMPITWRQSIRGESGLHSPLLLQPEFTYLDVLSTESSVDDLGTCRGVVLRRAVTILRSIETQPLTGRFVRSVGQSSAVITSSSFLLVLKHFPQTLMCCMFWVNVFVECMRKMFSKTLSHLTHIWVNSLFGVQPICAVRAQVLILCIETFSVSFNVC